MPYGVSMSREVDGYIAGNVRAEIARARFEVAELSETIGVSRSSLFRKLSGDTSFSASEIVSIASALGVSPAVLIAPPTGLEPVTL